MAQLRLAGFTAVRVTSNWLPGLTAPTAHELTVLRNVEAAARLSGVKVYVSVYHPGSRTTPLELSDQTDFARYAAALARAIPTFDDIIVGNEPNLNRFWLPQFGLNGANASAPAYLQLLGRTYDALKAADPTLRVWGGALAPRGSDRPDGIRPTSSPDRVHPGDGRRLPRQRPHGARDGRLRDAPVPGQLVDEPEHRRTRATRRSGSRTTTSSSRSSRAPSTGRPRPARPCRSSTTSSGSSRSSPTASGRSTRGTSRRRRSPSTSRSRLRPTTSG